VNQKFLWPVLLLINLTIEEGRRQSIPTVAIVRRQQAFYDGKQQQLHIHTFKRSNQEVKLEYENVDGKSPMTLMAQYETIISKMGQEKTRMIPDES
jgi:hypothetical protein